MSARGWVRVDGNVSRGLQLRGIRTAFTRRAVRGGVSGDRAPSWAYALYHLEKTIVDLAAPGAQVSGCVSARLIDWRAVWAKARRYPRWRRALLAVYDLECARQGTPTVDALTACVTWLLHQGAVL